MLKSIFGNTLFFLIATGEELCFLTELMEGILNLIDHCINVHSCAHRGK